MLSQDFFYSVYPITHHGVPCGDFLLTALTLYHILSGLSRDFSEISEIFSGVGRVHFCGSIPIPTRRSRPTPWTGLLPRPLTLQIIAHLPSECNRQNAQNRDFYSFKLCATFLLTKCWRYVIMEICAPHTRGRADEIAYGGLKKPTAFVSRSQKRWGKFNSIIVGYFGSHPYRFFIMSSLQVRSGLKKTAEPSIIGG